MLTIVEVVSTLFVLVGSHLLWRWISAQYLRRKNEPPLISGLPLIGMGIEYQKGGWALLKKSQQQYGDIFTFYMAGKRFHYVMDPITFSEYFKERNTLGFHEVIAEFMKNVFRVETHLTEHSNPTFTKHYQKYLSGPSLVDLRSSFDHYMDIEIAKVGATEWKECDLVDFSRRMFFKASVDTIFGTDLLKEDYESFLNDYVAFDREVLDMMSGILPAKEGRAALKRCVDRVVKRFRAKDCSTLMQERFKYYDQEQIEVVLGATFHMATMFGSQSNTLMAAFWTLANIISRPDVVERVRSEFGQEQTLFLEACFHESLRLSSSTYGVRICRDDYDLVVASQNKTYRLRKGDQVMAVAEAAHRDPELYPNPDQFVPDRFLDTKALTKNGQVVSVPFLPFGKGTTMCPGRHFAKVEVFSLVTRLLTKFDFQVIDPVPKMEPTRQGLGIMVPQNPMRVRYRIRSS
ncbi:cytochrome P450 [Gorgonomyces haynaldii]|nr:cytochrome P450 [Gorgonomyces haynaldii]